MDASKRRVSEVMQSEVATLTVQDRLDLAEDVMRLGRVRHMPVLDGTKLVGHRVESRPARGFAVARARFRGDAAAHVLCARSKSPR